MQTRIRLWLRYFSIALLAACIAGCDNLREGSLKGTFDYREVQREFGEAVQLDNLATVDPFVDGQSAPRYASVADTLTEERITALDDRLEPNAWMLRAVAQWRSGRYKQAIGSAEHGLRSPALAAQSRDHILLTLLPALAVDSELRDRWLAQGKKTNMGDYEGNAGYRRSFETAFDRLREAEALMGAATPTSVRYYVSYQKWRLLSDWQSVIGALPNEALFTAQDAATAFLEGTSLETAAAASAKTIAAGTPLRQAIQAAGGP